MGQRRAVQLCLILVIWCNTESLAGFIDYASCTSYDYRDLIGNSICDREKNIETCGIYSSDCYECTCDANSCFSQLDNGFNHGDSESVTERYVSMKVPPGTIPCSPERHHVWVVGNTSQARALAEALNCSGGVFNVKWRGSVVIDITLSVFGGTVLNVTGISSGAVMDGGGTTRLLTVVNSSLYVSNMVLFNGGSVSGGAIAAFGSNIFVNQTRFVGNIATLHGGAMILAEGSTATFSGQTDFFNNIATCRGGAVCVRDRSHATWANGATFSNNNASFGGAVDMFSSSSASWTGIGVTTFSNNTAGLGGGLTVGANSSANWETVSIFEGNTAYSGGGVFFSGGNGFWGGHTFFSGNVVDGHGGALYAKNQSTLLWVSEAVFSSNTAYVGGGAAYITALSIASWTAATSFYNNTASIGGGIYLTSASVGSWSGYTILVQNVATSRSNGGGAVRLEEGSTFWWKGETRFFDNTAYGYGGALFISGNSSASWEGKSVFVGNNASILGGALLVANGSSVSWDTDTSFVTNNGQYGGALCVADSSVVSWRGSTLFHNNTAESGGAVVVAANSCVEMIGNTNFTANQAQMNGGAVSSTTLFSVPSRPFSQETSNIVFGGKASFAFNTCGWSGGAMALSDLLSVETASTAAITFLGNSANVLGGAILIAAVETAFVFRGVLFDSNRAQAGGGVFAFASGTTLSSDSITGNAVENWSIFDSCSFVNNVAYTIGGAIHSAYRLDVIVNTIFVGNVAFAGGALLLSGSAYLANTSFLGNVASAGPAVFNFGYMTGMTSIAFHDNAPSCDNGSFINFKEVSRS